MSEKVEPTEAMTHVLKTWPEFYDAIARGDKTFEVRKNDRDYMTGDWLKLVRYDPDTLTTSGEPLYRRVTYVMHGGAFGLDSAYVVMGLAAAPSPVPDKGNVERAREIAHRWYDSYAIKSDLGTGQILGHLIDAIASALSSAERGEPVGFLVTWPDESTSIVFADYDRDGDPSPARYQPLYLHPSDPSPLRRALEEAAKEWLAAATVKPATKEDWTRLGAAETMLATATRALIDQEGR